jgi:malonate-semialdehyde dehydrogenase (acetylating)/methylmalonate-semialdehyde dehydrogenase
VYLLFEAHKTFRDSIAKAASNLQVGNGLHEGVQMGPVISAQSKSRIESLIGVGEKEGANVLRDGIYAAVWHRESPLQFA